MPLTSGKYIIDANHNIIEETNLLKWAAWFEKSQKVRTVARDEFLDKHGASVRVSTIFLGMDHSFEVEPHTPILFETMIFGGEHEGDCCRYATWDEAVEGHKIAILKAHGEYDGALEVTSMNKI